MLKKLLKEEVSKGVQQAIHMGLKHTGFGLYMDPNSGKITHHIKNGALEPIAKSHEKAGLAKDVVKSNPNNSFDKEDKMQGHFKKAVDLHQKVNKEIDDHFEDEENETEKLFGLLMKAQVKALGGEVHELMDKSPSIRMALGEYFGAGARVLNAFASKELVKEFDTNKGKNPMRPVGDPGKSKLPDLEQNYSNLIRTIDKVIDKCELPQPIIAYRGISVDNAEQITTEHDTGGNIINLPAFTSFTLDKDTAMEHSEGCELIVRFPAGTKALLVEPTEDEHDMELILKRGSKLRVDKIEEHGDDQKVFTCTLIAQ